MKVRSRLLGDLDQIMASPKVINNDFTVTHFVLQVTYLKSMLTFVLQVNTYLSDNNYISDNISTTCVKFFSKNKKSFFKKIEIFLGPV